MGEEAVDSPPETPVLTGSQIFGVVVFCNIKAREYINESGSYHRDV